MVCSIIPEPTVVSGLYFKSVGKVYKFGERKGEEIEEYFPATYEKAMELIAQALKETSTIEIAKDRPDLEDYKKAEEDDE